MTKLLNDERFKNVSYHTTDIRKTWDRERKRLAKLKAEQEAADAEVKVKVRQIKAKGAK